MDKEDLLEKIEQLNFWIADIIGQCQDMLEDCQAFQDSLFDLEKEVEE